jgi:hypothetical protein
MDPTVGLVSLSTMEQTCLSQVQARGKHIQTILKMLCHSAKYFRLYTLWEGQQKYWAKEMAGFR